MSKRGRPRRQDVERNAAGRIKPSVYRMGRAERRAAMDGLMNDENSLAIWRRIRDLTLSASIDARLGTKLGRMFVVSDPISISAHEFEAGLRFAQILFDYDRLVLGMHRTAQAQNLARTKGLAWTEENPKTIQRAGNALMLCLTALGGREVTRYYKDQVEDRPVMVRDGVCAVTEALCRDELVGDPKAAKTGLQLLAQHFGLYDGRTERLQRWQDRYRKLPPATQEMIAANPKLR